MPLPGIVMPLILKPHRDMVAVERPEILDQAVFVLLRPFARKERDDGGAAFEKLGAVAPAAVLGIGRDTRSGSLEFQASSAIRAFWAAVSRVNSGNGGRDMVTSGFGAARIVSSLCDQSMAPCRAPDHDI
jgi:hypothetical protein